MATSENITAWIALFLGLYYIAIGIGALTAPENWTRMIREMQRSPFEELLGGIVAAVIGLVLLLVIPPASDILTRAMQLFGVLALIKGLVLMALPGRMLHFSAALLAHRTTVFAIATIVIGLALIGAALTHPLFTPHN